MSLCIELELFIIMGCVVLTIGFLVLGGYMIKEVKLSYGDVTKTRRFEPTSLDHRLPLLTQRSSPL